MAAVAGQVFERDKGPVAVVHIVCTSGHFIARLQAMGELPCGIVHTLREMDRYTPPHTKEAAKEARGQGSSGGEPSEEKWWRYHQREHTRLLALLYRTSLRAR